MWNVRGRTEKISLLMLNNKLCTYCSSVWGCEIRVSLSADWGSQEHGSIFSDLSPPSSICTSCCCRPDSIYLPTSLLLSSSPKLNKPHCFQLSRSTSKYYLHFLPISSSDPVSSQPKFEGILFWFLCPGRKKEVIDYWIEVRRQVGCWWTWFSSIRSRSGCSSISLLCSWWTTKAGISTNF